MPNKHNDKYRHKFEKSTYYDSFTLNAAILTAQPDAQIVIPPPSTAIVSPERNTQRDEHIRNIEEAGRMAWQKKNNWTEPEGKRTSTTNNRRRDRCAYIK